MARDDANKALMCDHKACWYPGGQRESSIQLADSGFNDKSCKTCKEAFFACFEVLYPKHNARPDWAYLGGEAG